MTGLLARQAQPARAVALVWLVAATRPAADRSHRDAHRCPDPHPGVGTLLWLVRRVTPATAEVASGLTFDQVE